MVRRYTEGADDYLKRVDVLISRLGEPSPATDARAQLWARVYAAEFEVSRHRPSRNEADARQEARITADAAVRDFDEHYLGGKR